MVNDQTIEALLEKYHGNITAVARAAKCSRQTIYNRIGASSSLKQALGDARETMLDEAENVLYERALQGNTAELIFFLKTRGKSRGYVERQEVYQIEWQDELIENLKNGRLSPADVLREFPDLAHEFFKKAGVEVD